MNRSFSSLYFFWAILALPSIPMILGLGSGADPQRLLHPTGEFAARFMIIAMMITPLRMIFPKVRWLLWLQRRLWTDQFAFRRGNPTIRLGQVVSDFHRKSPHVENTRGE